MISYAAVVSALPIPVRNGRINFDPIFRLFVDPSTSTMRICVPLCKHAKHEPCKKGRVLLCGLHGYVSKPDMLPMESFGNN